LRLAILLLLAMLFGLSPAMPAATPPLMAQATAPQPADDSLRIYAVHLGELYGIYLGKGLIITAAHVVPADPKVRIAGLEVAARVIKVSPLEQFDLALLSVDESQLPVSMRLRRMTLCQGRPVVGSAVVVAIPEATARSWILSPAALPPQARSRFPTVISHVKSTGNSGSGVFDAAKHCLLGIMSRKIVQTSPSGENSMDIAKYFVPAWVIREFVPSQYPF
jgi:S1-C subfamily serine protease